MKLKLLGGVALAGVFAANGALAAPADTGWYGAVDIGAHFIQRLNTTSSVVEDSNGPYKFKFSQETNWAGFARIGYKVSPNLRIELEGGYRPGSIRSILDDSSRPVTGICGSTSSPCTGPGGTLESWSLMGNG